MARTYMLLAAVLLAAAAPALAADDPIKVRVDAMKGMGDAMKALDTAVMFGEADAAAKSGAATILATVKRIPHLFPSGSDKGDTRALPKIWSDPDGFAKAAKEATRAAEVLDKAVASGDMAATKDAFEGIKKACGGCHHDYRAKKEDM